MENLLRKIGEYFILDVPSDIFSREKVNNLKEYISEIIDRGGLDILLNMTNVEKIDGVGLGVLLSLQRIAFINEVNIRLYGLQPYVMQMMFQTRLNKVLDICQPEDEILINEELLEGILIA